MSKITGTQKAFYSVIRRKDFAVASGVSKSTLSQWRSGKIVPSINKMEQVLLDYGKG